MLKNKAAKALIIGACLTVSSMAGVYADTNNVEVKPAIIQAVNDESEIMTIQIAAVNNEDVLTQKQKEIDEYVFENNREELEKKGIIVTSTGVVGDVVEVSITPYDVKNVDYLYELFGKDMVSVVAGEQAVPLEYVTMDLDDADKAAYSGMAVEEEEAFFETVFKSIVEWFKSIF